MRAIDADALIYGLRDYMFTLNPDDTEAAKEYSFVKRMTTILENAPTIEPERKKGRWIPQNLNKSDGMISTAVYYYPKCSVCGANANYTNFCPNCGAEMTEGEG